jgi:hypothetical protein
MDDKVIEIINLINSSDNDIVLLGCNMLKQTDFYKECNHMKVLKRKYTLTGLIRLIRSNKNWWNSKPINRRSGRVYYIGITPYLKSLYIRDLKDMYLMWYKNKK